MYEVRRVLETMYKTNTSEGNVSCFPSTFDALSEFEKRWSKSVWAKSGKDKVHVLEADLVELIVDAAALRTPNALIVGQGTGDRGSGIDATYPALLSIFLYHSTGKS
jgi:hypothetical protein